MKDANSRNSAFRTSEISINYYSFPSKKSHMTVYFQEMYVKMIDLIPHPAEASPPIPNPIRQAPQKV